MPNTQATGVAYADPEFTTCYASEEIGYSAAAQGAVTQLTDKSTGVTLNKSAGRITMHNAALAGGAVASFILTNSMISAKDTLIVTVGSNTTGSVAGAYTTYISYMAAGTALISLRNLSATSYSEAVVINFTVIHCAA